MRLGDLDALKEEIGSWGMNDYEPSDFIDAIDNAPTVEPERPQGEWIERTDRITLDTYYECSNCKEPWTTIEGTPWQNMMNYCPNCGARMKGGNV